MRLWEPATGAPVDAALKTEGAVLALAFGGPQGEWLVAGGESPLATLWSMAGPPFKAVPLEELRETRFQRLMSYGTR